MTEPPPPAALHPRARRKSWGLSSNLNGALNTILRTLLPVTQLPYIPVVTHTAVLEVVGLMLAASTASAKPTAISKTAADANSKAIVGAVMGFIGKLMRNPALKPYWEDKDAVYVYCSFRDRDACSCCPILVRVAPFLV